MHQRGGKSGLGRGVRRRRFIAAAATALAILVLAVAGYVIFERWTRPDPLKPFQIYRSPDAPEYS